MTRYVSSRNPVSVRALKRRPIGTIVFHHNGIGRNWEDVKFTRVNGGWKRERVDFVGLDPTIVSSTAVANECNKASGYKENWVSLH